MRELQESNNADTGQTSHGQVKKSEEVIRVNTKELASVSAVGAQIDLQSEEIALDHLIRPSPTGI